MLQQSISMPIMQQLESQVPGPDLHMYLHNLHIFSSINLATHNRHDEDQGLRYVLSHNRPPAPNTLGRVSRPQGK